MEKVQKIKKYKSAKNKIDDYYSIQLHINNNNFEKAKECFNKYYKHLSPKELETLFEIYIKQDEY